jgi:predicted Zn-dependent peptidase
LLERAFGDWRSPAGPALVKPMATPIPPPAPRIVVIDRPASPQSVIYAGKVLPVSGNAPGLEPLDLANSVIGNGFLSRLNMQLREEKGWSYGVGTNVTRPTGPRSLLIGAPVQTDRTGDSIRLIINLMRAYPAAKPTDAEELLRVTDGTIRSLPSSFETNSQVLQAMVRNDLLGRPDNFYATLASRYRTIDGKAIDAAARTYLQPDGLTFVVVGTRKLIEPQLKGIGLLVEYVSAPVE